MHLMIVITLAFGAVQAQPDPNSAVDILLPGNAAAVALSPDGLRAATVRKQIGRGCVVTFWNLAERSGRDVVTDPRVIENDKIQIVYATDGKTVVVHIDGVLRFLDAATGKVIAEHAREWLQRVCGESLLSTRQDDANRLRTMVRSVADGKRLLEMDGNEHYGMVKDLAPDGSLAALCAGNTVLIGDGKTGNLRQPIVLRERAWGVAAFPGGKRVLILVGNGAQLFEWTDPTQPARFKGNIDIGKARPDLAGRPNDMVAQPDGTMLFAIGHRIVHWDIEKNVAKGVYAAHSDIGFNRQTMGRYIHAVGKHVLQLIDLEAGQSVVSGPNAWMRPHFAAAAGKIASSDGDGRVRIRSTTPNNELTLASDATLQNAGRMKLLLPPRGNAIRLMDATAIYDAMKGKAIAKFDTLGKQVTCRKRPPSTPMVPV